MMIRGNQNFNAQASRRWLRHAWQMLLGLLLAVAMLLAMALPTNAAYGATGDSEDCSATTLPVKENGTSVTWQEVRDYIDKNFTGSKVFADAVYNAICTSGQDFSKTNYGDNGDKTLRSAAEVIQYYGAGTRFGGTIIISQPLETGAVLTGIGLLNKTVTLRVENVGSNKGLGFMEDAFTPAPEGKPAYDTAMGPAVIIDKIYISELPKRVYGLNLPRTTGNRNYHNFQTTAYNYLPLSILRVPGDNGDTQLSINSMLSGRDGVKVDLGSLAGSASDNTSGTVIRPTEAEAAENNDRRCNPWAGCPTSQKNEFHASDNRLSLTIPNGGNRDGDVYWFRLGFASLYNYYANSAIQRTSIDYFYQTVAEYLNRVRVSGSQVILSGLNVQKVDKSDVSKGLNGATFELYSDKNFQHRAQQADLSSEGKPQFVTNGNGSSALKMKDTGVYTSATINGTDGVIAIDNLLPGTYYLKETKAPDGYKAESEPIEVTVTGEDIKKTTVTGGAGETAMVAKDKVTADATNSNLAWDWDTAWNDNKGNVTVTSGTEQKSALEQGIAGSGVFVKNKNSQGSSGNPIALTKASIPNDLKLLGSSSDKLTLTTTAMDNEQKTEEVNNLSAAQDVVNGLIADDKLDASNALISVDTGIQVYRKAIPSTIQKTIPNTKTAKPVNVALEAQKNFKDSDGNDKAITNGQFSFALTPGNANAKLLAKDALQASVGTDGKATWNLPSITADTFAKATKNDKGVASFDFTASEVAGSDANVKYDKTTIPVRLDVSETKTGTSEGLKVEVFVNNKSVGSATSGKDAATWKVSPKDSGIEFTNTSTPTPVTGPFSFYKRDGDSGTDLTGAKFSLYQCKAGKGQCGDGLVDPDNPGSAWTLAGSVESGDDGVVAFPSVERPGEYRLVEVQAPAGYQKPSGQWKVTFPDRHSKPEFTAVGGQVPAFCELSKEQCPGGSNASAGVSAAGVSPMAASTPTWVVPNYRTIAVPSTGGRGLVFFSLAGFGLLLAGVTVLSIEARRRG